MNKYILLVCMLSTLTAAGRLPYSTRTIDVDDAIEDATELARIIGDRDAEDVIMRAVHLFQQMSPEQKQYLANPKRSSDTQLVDLALSVNHWIRLLNKMRIGHLPINVGPLPGMCDDLEDYLNSHGGRP